MINILNTKNNINLDITSREYIKTIFINSSIRNKIHKKTVEKLRSWNRYKIKETQHQNFWIKT